MPNNFNVNPRAYAIVAVVSIGTDVAGMVVKIPEQLLAELQLRAANFGVQYATIAIGQTIAQKVVNVEAPVLLFQKGMDSLATATDPLDASAKGCVAIGALMFSGIASKDAQSSAAWAAFILAVTENVLFPGSQLVIPPYTVKIYSITKIIIRLVAEIRVERKRRKLGLPRKLFNFNTKNRKDLNFRVWRFKKKKIKFLRRNLNIPILYQKEISLIKSPMVEPIFL